MIETQLLERLKNDYIQKQARADVIEKDYFLQNTAHLKTNEAGIKETKPRRRITYHHLKLARQAAQEARRKFEAYQESAGLPTRHDSSHE